MSWVICYRKITSGVNGKVSKTIVKPALMHSLKTKTRGQDEGVKIEEDGHDEK